MLGAVHGRRVRGLNSRGNIQRGTLDMGQYSIQFSQYHSC